MTDTTEIGTTPKLELCDTQQATLELENWSASHALYATLRTGCLVNFTTPKVSIKFYLKKIVKQKNTFLGTGGGYHTKALWYNLCAELIQLPSYGNFAVKVTAADSAVGSNGEGTIRLSAGKPKSKEVEVIDELVHMKTDRCTDNYGVGFSTAITGSASSATSLKLSLQVSLYELKDPNQPIKISLSETDEKKIQIEEALAFVKDIKDLYVEGGVNEEDDHADLQVETKDKVTLYAHKFILAARSSYLRRKLAGITAKKTDPKIFRLHEMGSDALQAILYWMYTGDLHDSTASLLEEIVEGAILLELNQLIKMLDRKLISLCTKENMFRLLNVAQKTALPTAVEDVALFIKEHL